MTTLFSLNNECPSLLNTFFNNFIGHTTFNTSIFFSGLVTGLDPNWDGTEIWLDYYHIDLSLGSSALLACISIWVIFGGVLLLSESIHLSTQDSNLKFEPKQEIKSEPTESNNNNRSRLNIVHSNMVNARGNIIPNQQFVWDKADPYGTKLIDLLFPYTRLWYNGRYGVVVHHGALTWDGNLRLTKPKVPEARILAMLAAGDIILSNDIPAVITPGSFGLSHIHIQEKI